MRGVKPNVGSRTLGRLAPALLSILIVIAVGSCGERGGQRYAAEKELFKAMKMRDELLSGGMRQEFVRKAIDGYRNIVSKYGGEAARAQGVNEIVVSAQMDLAELEFRAGMLRESRADFEKAVEIAGNVPAARANALYSAGFISEELGEPKRAIELYERFLREFLNEGSLSATAAMNRRYLVTPLKLADLSTSLGAGNESARRLGEAERIYLSLIGRETNEGLLKEVRFNLLTTYLQKKDWSKALGLAGDMMKRYPESVDAAALSFIVAKIYEDGLRETQRALAGYLELVDAYPQSREAPGALLHVAAVRLKNGNVAEARKLYTRVVDQYQDRVAEVVEANWQLAMLDENGGNWDDASLRYKSIYSRYPETIQGFEAPLHIANSYRDKGEPDAAKAAYRQALEHYDRLASGEHPASTKIMAEQYAVRTFVEEKLWNEAIERLLRLPDRYPGYTPFNGNCLRAAAIYEQELKDRDGAIRVLTDCAAKYPGSEFAEAAAKELNRLKGGSR